MRNHGDAAPSRDDAPIRLEPGSIGVIADIHANPFALAAVLGHGADHGVGQWLVLGDVVAMGPCPGQVLDQLDAVDVVASIAGNTERYVLTGDRPEPTLEQVAADPAQLPRLVDVVGSFAWTKGYLEALDRLDTLRSFRPRVRLRLPDGTAALAVHASLAADDGRGICPDLEEWELASLFPDPQASIIFGGHTHRATDKVLGGLRLVNPGSVSNHHRADLVAGYSILRVDGDGHRIEHHEVGYDKTDATGAIRSCGIPGSEFLLSRYFAAVPR